MSKRILSASATVGVIALVFGFSCPHLAGAADASRLAIGTAGTTGVYYLYGGALANVISKSYPRIKGDG
jgi:TRAP-type uncharacterized transport system substrate-binding protein